MVTKTFEIRDRDTFVPAIAVKLQPACEADRYLLARAGFGTQAHQQGEYVLLAKIDGGDGKLTCDPYAWDGRARTMRIAHGHIIRNFDELESGAVIDVQYIEAETLEAKTSERFTDPV